MIIQLPTILYAVIAALSPLAFSATVVVLRGDRGRVNGALFTVGFVTAEAVVCIIGLLVDSVSISRPRGHPVLAAALSLAAGLALLVAAVVIRRRPGPPPDAAPKRGRSDRLLKRLSRLNPVEAVVAGMAFGVGGPKRIALTLLAATTISAAVDRLGILQISLAGIFVVVACALVWFPALAYLTAGPSALWRLEELERNVGAHRRQAEFYASLGFGGCLVGAGVINLVGR